MLSDRSRVSSESPARLEVRLLGAVEVILDGRRLGAFNSLRLQRFLALLAVRRDLQHRSRLAFELWPDSDERQARTNLRKLLHDFRHSLPDIGEFVEIDNEIVRWIPTGPSEVDVLRFREAILKRLGTERSCGSYRTTRKWLPRGGFRGSAGSSTHTSSPVRTGRSSAVSRSVNSTSVSPIFVAAGAMRP
jgi:hypothetical protein